jgi:hypothetical protein
MENEKVIIRTYSAGVHYGTLVSESPSEGGYHVILENSRRIWKWAGANSLSELATLGTSNPGECNFALPVKKIKLLAIEIISMTDEAINSIESVPNWVFSQDTEKVNRVLAEMGAE